MTAKTLLVSTWHLGVHVLNTSIVGFCTSNDKESKQVQNVLNSFPPYTMILVTAQNEYLLFSYL